MSRYFSTASKHKRLAFLTFFWICAGQLFILHTIKEFGALLFAAVMTTRQFLSILVSSVLFANPLSLGQWCDSKLADQASHLLVLDVEYASSWRSVSEASLACVHCQ